MDVYYGELDYYTDRLQTFGYENRQWLKMSTDAQKRILSQLSIEFDTSHKWIGKKVDTYQSLEFPRSFDDIVSAGDNLNNIYILNQGLVPESLYQCIFEMLLIELAPEKYEKLYDRGIKTFNDGVLSVSLNPSNKRTLKLIERYMFEFTTIGFSITR